MIGQLLEILQTHWFLNTTHCAILGSQVYWILALRKDSVDMMHQALKHYNIKKIIFKDIIIKVPNQMRFYHKNKTS